MEKKIIIIGAGPAGIATALNIARLAPELIKDIIILEKHKHPRPKLCGGGILLESVSDYLKLDINEISFSPVRKVFYKFNNQQFFRENNPVVFRVVDRKEFDFWLVNKARELGINIIENVKVLKLNRSKNQIEVITNKETFRSLVVVGADGSKSIVRRFIDPNGKSNYAMALQVFIHPDNYLPVDEPESAIFDFSISNYGVQGYFWTFPMLYNGRNTVNKGICDFRFFKRKRKLNLKRIFKEILEDDGIDFNTVRCKGLPVHIYNPKTKISAPNVLLVGDAIGVDPFSGEGIRYAFDQGEFAAHQIIAGILNNNFQFKHYQQQYAKSQMGKLMKKNLFAAHLLHDIKNKFLKGLLFKIMRS